MDAFEYKLRVLHTRSIERIMNHPIHIINNKMNLNSQNRRSKMNFHKNTKSKAENISTYMRRFQVQRENINLAKRILQCQSAHNKQKYAKQWRKNKNYMRVRSNFKKAITTQSPRIFKYQPIVGRGKFLVQIIIKDIISNNNVNHNQFQTAFNQKHIYFLKIFIGGHQIISSNKLFSIHSLRQKGQHSISFYIPSFLKKKQILCKLNQIIQNQSYQKGRFVIKNLNSEKQEIQILNKSDKSYGKIILYAQGINMRQFNRGKSSENNKQNQNFCYQRIESSFA